MRRELAKSYSFAAALFSSLSSSSDSPLLIRSSFSPPSSSSLGVKDSFPLLVFPSSSE